MEIDRVEDIFFVLGHTGSGMLDFKTIIGPDLFHNQQKSISKEYFC